MSQTEQQLAAIPVSQSEAMMQTIERAALNPEVDVDKMERLWAMKEKIDDKEAEMVFNASMTKMQLSMGRISADATNPQTRSKYATYAALDKALRPVYTENGFALSFDTSDSPKDNCVRVVCYLSHISGHSRDYHVDMPADGKGAKGGDVMTKTHAAGAAMSYGSRYLLKMIFNVAIGEDDDDGNGAAGIPRITEEQVLLINAKITDNDLNMPKFMKWLKSEMKCDSIDQVSVKAFNAVMGTIDAQIKKEQNK